MKISRVLALASVLVSIAPTVSFADCNPPCKGDRVCRYDSTHNPQFFCRKPVAPQSAPPTAQAPASVAPAKPAPWVNSIEFPTARAKESSTHSKGSKTDNCAKWEGPEYDATKRAHPKKC